MLKYRPVIKKDLKTICSFPQNREELFFFYPKAEYPLTTEQLQHAIDRRSDSTVVEENNHVVGFANFYHWTDGRCSIGNVIVAPFKRGEGVATCLINTMMDLALRRHAASEVNIACFNRNTSALLLYAKLGFLPYRVEERNMPDGRRTALIHMKAHLSDISANKLIS